MNWLYRLMFRQRVRRWELSASVLGNFIQQVYWGDNLSERESKHSLQKGLLEIRHRGQHSSNGILISRNGYFLTAKHCVDHNLDELDVQNDDGEVFPLERVCAYAPKHDIALAKASIPGDWQPWQYRIYNTNGLQRVPVAVMTRWSEELQTNYGFIEKTRINGDSVNVSGRQLSFGEHFTLSMIDVRPGDSGGIVISPDGRLIGMMSTGNDYNSGSAIKIIKALELVDYHRRRIEEKLQ